MGSIVSGILGAIGGAIQGRRIEKAAQPAVDIAAQQRQLLGVGQDPQNAFQNYLDSTGYKFQMEQGSKAITGNRAAAGLLNSGGTARALTDYGQQQGRNYFSQYLGQLSNASATSLAPVQAQGDAAASRAGGFNSLIQGLSAPLVRRFGY